MIKDEIQVLIGNGKLDEALNRLVSHNQEAVVLKAQLSNINKEYRMGLIDHSEYARHVNRINYAILGMLDSIQETQTAASPSASYDSPKNTIPTNSKEEKDGIPKIFFSYSHDDHKYLKDLLTYLAPLERANKIKIWTDTQILPGQ
jgi:Effector-associated domain 11